VSVSSIKHIKGFTPMKLFIASSILLLSLTAQTAIAGPNTKVSILWQDFPKGTKCSAQNIKGELKHKKKRGHPKVDVTGFGEVGTFFCVLPDGRTVTTDVNKRLPNGTRVAGITIYPDGRTYLTASTSGDLVNQEFKNTISIKK